MRAHKGNPETPTQILRRLSKSLRKEIYKSQKSQPDLAQYFPEKPAETAEIEEEIKYSKELIEALENRLESKAAQKLKDRVLEILESDRIKSIQSGYDDEARVGHKTADTSFFGYKSHIAINDERLITAVEVTPGQEPDTARLQKRKYDTIKQWNGAEGGKNEATRKIEWSGETARIKPIQNEIERKADEDNK